MSPLRKVLFLTAILILATMTASMSPLDDSLLLGYPTRNAIAHQATKSHDLTAADSGLPIGTSFLIENLSSDLSNPSAAYDSSRNEYWVVYEANNYQTIRAARLSAQGRVLSSTDIAYHPSQVLKNPDLAYNSATGAPGSAPTEMPPVNPRLIGVVCGNSACPTSLPSTYSCPLPGVPFPLAISGGPVTSNSKRSWCSPVGTGSVGNGLQAPAVNALLPQIVPPNRLIRVNSLKYRYFDLQQR